MSNVSSFNFHWTNRTDRIKDIALSGFWGDLSSHPMFYIIQSLEVFTAEVKEMPHVVLNGNVDLEDIFLKLKPILVRDNKTLLKTASIYIERNKRNILVDSLVIEDGNGINFFAMVNSREDGIVVRIHPICKFEKTSNVKRLVADIAKQLMQLYPDLKVGETNLTEYLES